MIDSCVCCEMWTESEMLFLSLMGNCVAQQLLHSRTEIEKTERAQRNYKKNRKKGKEKEYEYVNICALLFNI